jgi:hypothetical protein
MQGDRSHSDNVQTAIKKIEASGDSLLIDQAAFLLGMWNGFWWLEDWTKDCPKIKALLPEMQAQPVAPLRTLTCAEWMDREDDLGYLADQLRKGGF